MSRTRAPLESEAVELLVKRLWDKKDSEEGLEIILSGKDRIFEIVDYSDKWLLVRSNESQWTNFACYPISELAVPFFESVKDKEGGPQLYFPGCAYALMSSIDYGNKAKIIWLQGGFESKGVKLPEGLQFDGNPSEYYGRFGNKLVKELIKYTRQLECAAIEYTHDSDVPGGESNVKIVVNNLLAQNYELFRLNRTQRTTDLLAVDINHRYAGIYSQNIDPLFIKIVKPL